MCLWVIGETLLLAVPLRVRVRHCVFGHAGWRIEPRKDSEGRIVSAVWSGGSIAPGETRKFSFAARNPMETTLVWKVIQVYADGSRAEWVGERGSRAPALVTIIRNSVWRSVTSPEISSIVNGAVFVPLILVTRSVSRATRYRGCPGVR